MAKQHTQPCRECPFRRVSPPGWLGGNHPQNFAYMATHECHFPCHLTMDKGRNELECAGRATMWANQAKLARDGSVPKVAPDRDKVFRNIREFTEHHGIKITAEELMFGPKRGEW